MPFCNQCGTQVAAADIYCAKCGTRQPTGTTAASPDLFSGLTARTAAILCYLPVIGWVASIVVLASERFRNNRIVRFHAFQGLYLFVAWLIVDQVIGPIFRQMSGPAHGIAHLLHAVVLVMWIFMIVKASQQEMFSLPIIGELAERSLSEK